MTDRSEAYGDSHITIPPEAFTAAELAYTEASSNGEDPLRAACLAMLRAWPGMAKPPLPPHPSEHHKGEET